MISPLPFLGPVGAVRIGHDRRRARRQPDAAGDRGESTLDLIVVGTKDGADDGRGRCRRGPRGRAARGARARPPEIIKLCEAQEELARQAGKPKWLDPSLTEELRARTATGSASDRERACARRGTAVEEIFAELCPTLTMESTEDDIIRQVQVRSSLNPCSSARASTPWKGPSALSSRPSCAALTDAEQDSKELKSAKRQLLFDRIIETVELPFPVGPATVEGEAPGQGHDDEAVRQAGRRRDLQGPRPQEDRGRQASPRRARHRGDPADRVRGRRLAAHARLGALHAWPDADHVAC